MRVKIFKISAQKNCKKSNKILKNPRRITLQKKAKLTQKNELSNKKQKISNKKYQITKYFLASCLLKNAFWLNSLSPIFAMYSLPVSLLA